MTEENYNDRTSPLFLRNQFKGSGEFNIPVIPKSDFSEEDLENLLLIGFDRAKNDRKNLNRMVHFFLYDYKFEKIWQHPDDYVDKLKDYKGVLSPDFSMYLEMNRTLQLYNTFRNRWCGAYLASKGIKVIPTINWGNEDTFDFCFQGVPKGSIVAVSTYMVQEHNNHADQKDFFLKGYNEMLRRIQPAKIICYSQPFPEMEGEIIPVDYELSSWKYQNKSQEILHTQPSRGMIVTKTILQPDELFQIVWKGSGSAYGGQWKPKKPGDEKFLGQPNSIQTFYENYRIDVKYGADGRAIMMRHYTSTPNPKHHTNPHDHIILWDPNRGNPLPQGPINYPNGAPEFKHYVKEEYSMNKTSKVPEGNSLEENRFQSISEFKWCVNDGGEVVFEWKGNHYGIGHPNNKILISANCYEKNGKFYNANTNQEYTAEDELWGDTADDILEFNVSGDRLRDVITQVTVLDRTI